MAGLYLVGAWLLTQVTSTLLPAFDAPSWALRGLIITLALGFIPAVIFSWIFELTPEGLKREEDVAPEHSITPADRAADGPHPLWDPLRGDLRFEKIVTSLAPKDAKH